MELSACSTRRGGLLMSGALSAFTPPIPAAIASRPETGAGEAVCCVAGRSLAGLGTHALSTAAAKAASTADSACCCCCSCGAKDAHAGGARTVEGKSAGGIAKAASKAAVLPGGAGAAADARTASSAVPLLHARSGLPRAEERPAGLPRLTQRRMTSCGDASADAALQEEPSKPAVPLDLTDASARGCATGCLCDRSALLLCSSSWSKSGGAGEAGPSALSPLSGEGRQPGVAAAGWLLSGGAALQPPATASVSGLAGAGGAVAAHAACRPLLQDDTGLQPEGTLLRSLPPRLLAASCEPSSAAPGGSVLAKWMPHGAAAGPRVACSPSQASTCRLAADASGSWLLLALRCRLSSCPGSCTMPP
jgi:hypothetical protein